MKKPRKTCHKSESFIAPFVTYNYRGEHESEENNRRSPSAQSAHASGKKVSPFCSLRQEFQRRRFDGRKMYWTWFDVFDKFRRDLGTKEAFQAIDDAGQFCVNWRRENWRWNYKQWFVIISHSNSFILRFMTRTRTYPKYSNN